MSIRDDLHQSLTYVLRREMPKPPKGRWWERDETQASILANKVLDHLKLCGFTFGREPPRPSHSWPPPEKSGEK